MPSVSSITSNVEPAPLPGAEGARVDTRLPREQLLLLPESHADKATERFLSPSVLAGLTAKPRVRPRLLYRPTFDVSLTGAVFIGMMLFMGLSAMNSQANLLFGVFGLMIGILLVSGSVSRLVLRRLTIRRELPEHGVVGVPMRTIYSITNLKRFWPSLSITVTELDGNDGFVIQPQCYLLHAAAGMTARVPADLIPCRRGLHAFRRLQISTSFPFGFIKRARLIDREDSALIYPAIGSVDRRLLASCRPADISGPNMRPKPGGTDEFYGVKEYRAGDPPRWIYWRRSARTGVLVSREMTEVAPPRVLLLVDTYLTNRSPDEHALVERTIAMAASLAVAALDQGLSLGLFAWSGEWYSMQPMRGKQQRADILSALAQLRLNTTHDSHELMDVCHPVLRTGATPILFTPRQVQMGLGEGGRSGMLVISAGTTEGRELFEFPPTVDFFHSMPASEQPATPGGRRIAAAAKTDNQPSSERA